MSAQPPIISRGARLIERSSRFRAEFPVRRVMLLALLTCGMPSQAEPCDAIRSQIDAKIRAAGVATFSLSVVASDARIDGQVVGTCALGTRKIIYRKGEAAAARPAVPRGPLVITECKDGKVLHGGDCKP